MKKSKNFAEVFKNFITISGAESEVAISTFLTLNLIPPSDYLNALQFTNGGEGYVRRSYLRLFSTEKLLLFNNAYQVEKFAPGLVLFGSNGGGEAFGFDTRKDPAEIVQIPFIPMDFKYAKSLGKSFSEFLNRLEEANNSDEADLPQINMSAVGKESHEIQPIVFGGSPEQDINKVLVPQEAHAELSVFWNQVYQRKVYGKERYHPEKKIGP